jgi:2-iminobutanoate/2-iminopropanoate deaminase
MKKVIETKMAPAPIGPYSQAVLAGDFLYISGQIAIVSQTGELDLTDIVTETHQVMKNLQAILQTAGASFDNVVKTSIFLKDMKQFAQVNTVYGGYFISQYPARETVEVSELPKNVNVEISMIAYIPQ